MLAVQCGSHVTWGPFAGYPFRFAYNAHWDSQVFNVWLTLNGGYNDTKRNHEFAVSEKPKSSFSLIIG